MSKSSFKERGIERMVYDETDEKLDELVMTGDIHIERTGTHNQCWMIRVGGVMMMCNNLRVESVSKERGDVPPQKGNLEGLSVKTFDVYEQDLNTGKLSKEPVGTVKAKTKGQAMGIFPQRYPTKEHCCYEFIER